MVITVDYDLLSPGFELKVGQADVDKFVQMRLMHLEMALQRQYLQSPLRRLESLELAVEKIAFYAFLSNVAKVS